MFLRSSSVFLVAVILSALLSLRPLAIAAPKADKAAASEIAELKKEVAALREENRRLRQLLIQRVDDQFAGPAEKPKAVPVPTPEEVAAAAGKKSASAAKYWLSSGGKRHNSKCRYFNGAGRACTKDEGVPCKICGG
jgi:hypothetical protein